MEALKDIIKEELKYENLKYSSVDALSDELKDLYNKLLGFLENDRITQIEATRQINQAVEEAYKNFIKQSEKELIEQFDYIQEKKEIKENFTGELIAMGVMGGSLVYLITRLKDLQKIEIARMYRNKELKSDKIYGKGLKGQAYSIVRTFSKAGREAIREKKVEIDLEEEKKTKTTTRSRRKRGGWQSIATLDSKTTPLCLSLHDVVYYEDEFSYGSIPQKPPRHYNCRSILYYFEDEPEDVPTLDQFLRDNPKEAKDLLGSKKYELFESGELPINSFLDIQGNRFYTLDEIKRDLE